jgi:hypothetical protein
MMRRLTRRGAVVLAALGMAACTGTVGGRGSGDDPGGSEPGTPGTPGKPGNPGSPGTPGNPGQPGPGTGGSTGTGPVPITPGVEVPGRTPLRRLTRPQYNATIRDLLGLNENAAGDFAGDEDAGGFASNIVSPIGEQQVEQYHAAAESLAGKAVAAGLTRLAPCAPPKATAAACADEFVRAFGKRAFRRPLTTEEVDRYKTVYGVGANGADFQAGVTLVITAMLESPNFLYLPEIGDRRALEKDGMPFDPYETASRLSYFLLGSMPDDELFAAADAGALKNADQVSAHARRLLASPKARDSIASFFTQWLELTDLGTLDKDAMLFPQFTPALRTAMADEIATFGKGVTLDLDGRLETLLTAGFSYPNAGLADLYGVPTTARAGANGATKIDLPKGQRAGLFTLAAVMAQYAHPDQTRPVGRGYLVSDKLLCLTPPPAPDNVNAMLPKPDPNVTTRERLDAHRKEAACASCHQLMDPYGLTFENYDAIGRYRTSDGKKPVDASGKALPEIGDVKDALDMMAKLAKLGTVRDCVTTQWFRYAMGRVELRSDSGTLAAAEAAFAKTDYGMRELLLGLAATRGFRYRALPQP